MFFTKFRLQDYSVCSHCGRELGTEAAKFCIYCGRELNHPRRQKFAYIRDKQPGIVAALLAKIAKIDGLTIDRGLADFISRLFDKMEIFYAADFEGFRKAYADVFESEKEDGRAISELIARLSPANEREAEFITTMLMDLIYYDGVLSDKEDFYMEQIAVKIGLGAMGYRRLKALYAQEYGTENKREKRETNEFDGSLTLSEAYEILGADESDSDAEIKKKYRDLVRKYHTDNFESKDLPPEMLNFAKEMTQKINAAYEIIKNHRGMR